MSRPRGRDGRGEARPASSHHPSPAELSRFAEGRSSAPETARIGLHLARCAECRRRLTLSAPATDRSNPYARALRRASETASRLTHRLDEPPGAIRGSLAHLRRLTPQEQGRAIRSTPRLQSVALARHLLDTCRASWSDDPHEAEELATLAALVGDHLPSREYGRRPLNDLRAEAWSLVGNCRRIHSDLTGVPAAFDRAAELLARGTGDPRERAGLLALRGSLLRDLGRPAAALDTIEHALDLIRRTNAPEERARHLVSRALVEYELGRPAEAVHQLLEKRPLIHSCGDRKIALLTELNLALLFNELGESDRAIQQLRSVGAVLERHGAQNEKSRVHWVTGRIFRKLGRFEEADAALRSARTGFRTARIPGDVALVDLDRARLHLEAGRPDRALRLAAGAFPILAARGMEPPTLEALDLFRQAGGLES